MSEEVEEIWRPNAGPQSWLISCPVFEVFYGGARGGGKTAGMLGSGCSILRGGGGMRVDWW